MSLSRPEPTRLRRLPWLAVVIGALAMPAMRALIPSPSEHLPVSLQLPVNGGNDPDLLDKIVHHSAVQPGSQISAMRWTGRALEVDVQTDSPRVVVLVDNIGHTSVVRLAHSGTAVLRMQRSLAAAPPFTVVVLAARGPSYQMLDKANVDTTPLQPGSATDPPR
ncbi:MAG: hypothetical protein GXP62_08815 [Oligoflexia bacterium]|nr:hypothetical protein [Oligoflexia bacterium]